MVIRTVTVAMILATVTGVASTTQAAHANKGGIPDAHAVHIHSRVALIIQHKTSALDPRLQYNMMMKTLKQKYHLTRSSLLYNIKESMHCHDMYFFV